MAGQGLLKRTHGGILPSDFSLHEPPFTQKAAHAATSKGRLGITAASLLPADGTVFIDSGTTCLEVGRALLDRPKLQIYTNSVPLLALAAEARAIVIALGGTVRPISMALTGALAQGWLQHLHFDAAVVGCSGIHPQKGPATTELTEASLKAEVLRRARQRVLVAHAEKWKRPAAVAYAPWSAFTHLVTDRVLTRDQKILLSSAGITLPKILSS